MSLKIKIDKENINYFNNLAYELDFANGKLPNDSEIVNHCLQELRLFEEFAGQSVTDYIKENYPEAFANFKSKT